MACFSSTDARIVLRKGQLELALSMRIPLPRGAGEASYINHPFLKLKPSNRLLTLPAWGCEVFICKHLCRPVKNLTVGQKISFPTPHTCEHHTPITNCLAAIIFLHPRLSFAGVSQNKSLCSEAAWRDTLIRSEDLRFSYHNRPFTKPHLNALRTQSTHSRDDLETIWGRQLPVLFCVSILCF